MDKGGNPYILHPVAVAALVDDPTEEVVALLHDVVEDGGVSLDALSGFGAAVVDAVDAITRRPGEDRGAYLARVAANTIARNVKIADLKHNSDISRIPEPNDADLKRREQYLQEIALLTS